MPWKQEFFFGLLLSITITMAATSTGATEEIKWFAACDGAPFAIRIQQATDLIARSFGIDGPNGVLVAGLEPMDSAACGGPELGDLVIKFGGRDIKHSEEFVNVAAASQIGNELPVVVLREGVEKTRVLKLAPPPAGLRTPTCEEFIPFANRMPPGSVEQMFGKRLGDMYLNELDQAIAIVTNCMTVQRSSRYIRGPADRQFRHIPFDLVLQPLAQQKHVRLAREQQRRERGDIELRKRIEVEMKATEARASAKRAAAQARFDAEQKAVQTVAKAEKCRSDCPRKLSNMLRELRSLGADEGGVTRFREVGREYLELLDEMPIDLKAALSSELDTFAKLYAQLDVAMSKAEYDLQANKQLFQEQAKQRKLAEERSEDHRMQLTADDLPTSSVPPPLPSRPGEFHPEPLSRVESRRGPGFE
jgi:hypothetical protein